VLHRHLSSCHKHPGTQHQAHSNADQVKRTLRTAEKTRREKQSAQSKKSLLAAVPGKQQAQAAIQ
jgi:hypothetical protein